MPNPTASDVYVNAILTNMSLAYMQSQDQFIADKVFPVIPVEYQSGRYFTYNREEWFRTEARLRAPSTESAGSGWRIDNTPTYYAPVYAVHKDIDDQVRANVQRPLDIDRDATEWTTRQMLLKKELLWTNQNFATSIWGLDMIGTASTVDATHFIQWSNANSSPIQDIENQRLAIAQTTGYTPNKLVIGPQVFAQLKNHPSILDRIKYTQKGLVTTDLLAELFEVDEVLVPMVVQNTAAEGLAGQYSFVYGKNALLVYAAPNPGLLTPSGGYTFAWTGYLGASAAGSRISSFRMEWLKSDRIEGEIAVDMRVVGAPLGVFFSGAVA